MGWVVLVVGGRQGRRRGTGIDMLDNFLSSKKGGKEMGQFLEIYGIPKLNQVEKQ